MASSDRRAGGFGAFLALALAGPVGIGGCCASPRTTASAAGASCATATGSTSCEGSVEARIADLTSPDATVAPMETRKGAARQGAGGLESLLTGVPLELFGGLDLGSLSLSFSGPVGGEDGVGDLWIDADLEGGRRDVSLRLNASLVAGEESSRAFVRGDAGERLVVEIPRPHLVRDVEATFYVFGVDVVLDRTDGSRDILDARLDWAGDEIHVDLSCERLGPPRFGPFGRARIDSSGPVRVTLRRADRGDGRRTWVARG